MNQTAPAKETIDLIMRSDQIMFSKNLATLLGGSLEAAIVQEVSRQCRLNESTGLDQYYRDGYWWCVKTYTEWQELYPWVVPMTIKRKIVKLQELGVLVGKGLDTKKFDRRKWYRVNPGFDLLAINN